VSNENATHFGQQRGHPQKVQKLTIPVGEPADLHDSL
jgi:hypothetical protein